MASVGAFSFINSIIHSKEIRTHDHLVCKRTLNYLDTPPQPFKWHITPQPFRYGHLDLAINHYVIYTLDMGPA